VDINIYGSIFTAKYAVPLLQKRGGGVIAFNSSLSAYTTPAELSAPMGTFLEYYLLYTHIFSKGMNLYPVTKIAIEQLCRGMASYERDNIKSYCIAPAVYRTKLVDNTVGN
jgi:NAD(P)-dependent dehydrogenase (short-subunit alcohol dehydrogenase family)